MAKGNANPADAYRKAQRHKEVVKNRNARKSTREEKMAKKDTFEMDDEIRLLTEKEDANSLTDSERNRLTGLRFDLARIKKVKEAYLKDHPDERNAVYRTRKPTAKQQADDAPRDARGRKLKTRRIFDERTGLPRHPERSLFYDPVMNPYGVAPPALLPGEIDSDAEDDEDEEEEIQGPEEVDDEDDIPMPDDDEDDLDSIPMPSDDPPLPSSPPLPPSQNPSNLSYQHPSTLSYAPTSGVHLYAPNLPPPPPGGPPIAYAQASAHPPPPGFPHIPSVVPPPPPGGPPIRNIPPPPPGVPPPPPGQPPTTYFMAPPPSGGFAAPALSYVPPMPYAPSTSAPAPSPYRTFVPPKSAGLPPRPNAPPAVISAEPELVDFKKEATTFVPSALKRKRPAPTSTTGVTGSVKMNAASDVEDGGGVAIGPALPPDLLGAVRKRVRQ
ncbi:WW domain binding protein 11-domain-containing protein [Auriculariales sp. MPI-PUGE-AT-0066]|nr:WW domain binding protein 11-domain-containing protein [Auriculariales sp. MPI-PUGE-AT-0066]